VENSILSKMVQIAFFVAVNHQTNQSNILVGRGYFISKLALDKNIFLMNNFAIW
jgi:ADP-glucose pyrophosphorylase